MPKGVLVQVQSTAPFVKVFEPEIKEILAASWDRLDSAAAWLIDAVLSPFVPVKEREPTLMASREISCWVALNSDNAAFSRSKRLRFCALMETAASSSFQAFCPHSKAFQRPYPRGGSTSRVTTRVGIQGQASKMRNRDWRNLNDTFGDLQAGVRIAERRLNGVKHFGSNTGDDHEHADAGGECAGIIRRRTHTKTSRRKWDPRSV